MGQRCILGGHLIEIRKLVMIVEVKIKRPNGQLKRKEERSRVKRRKHT